MRETIVPAGTRILNAYNNETFVFTQPCEETSIARFDVVLGYGGSGGGNAVEHIHPNSDEIFTVHSGRVMVMIDGREHYATEGQSVTVPKGARHFFRNDFDGETHLTVTFPTAQQHLRFFLNLARWTAEEPRNFKRDGSVKLLPVALALHAFRDHLYIAGPPIPVQKLLFTVLSPVARLFGYRLAVEPRAALTAAIEQETLFAQPL
jgi:mannose-6-phosphate isomerase-like protein (cupin superfamily)